MLLLILQNIQQQRRGVLNHITLHQEVHDGVGVDQGTPWALDQHPGEAGGVGWVAVEDGDEEGHPVGGVVFFLDEGDELVWEGLGDGEEKTGRERRGESE
jgi:hypothetical protein